MPSLLQPDLWAPSVLSLDPLRLQARGIRGLIIDLDNTLVRWNTQGLDAALLAWLDRLRAAGLGACVLSNNRNTRVAAFCEWAHVPGIGDARKPRRRAYRLALQLLGTTPSQTAVVGDQVFTDVLGGRRMGLFTILVHPLDRREFAGTRLLRVVERLWLGVLRRRGRLITLS